MCRLRNSDSNYCSFSFFTFFRIRFHVNVEIRVLFVVLSIDVAIFVHMMEGEHDDLLQWPFTGTITLSIMDRSGVRNNDISQIVQATPNLSAFHRPREAICRKGCGFIKFARIEQVFGPNYVKKDKLLLKIEFSN